VDLERVLSDNSLYPSELFEYAVDQMMLFLSSEITPADLSELIVEDICACDEANEKTKGYLARRPKTHSLRARGSLFPGDLTPNRLTWREVAP